MSRETVFSRLAKDIARGIPSRIAPDLRAFMATKFRRSFDTQGRSEGRKWAGFQREPKYRAFKGALTGNLEPLKWNGAGDLYNSVARENGARQVHRLSGPTYTYGTRLPYADALTRGGTGPFGERFPARKFLLLSQRTRAQLADLLLKSIAGERVPASRWRTRS